MIGRILAVGRGVLGARPKARYVAETLNAHDGSAHISLQAQISRRQYGLPYEYLSPTFRRRHNYLRVKGNLGKGESLNGLP